MADELGTSTDVLRKALSDGRLSMPETMPAPVASTMSERTQTDAQAADAMGTACVRVLERCEASLGAGAGAPVFFERCLDVPMGGVLCALPALLENGLLSSCENLASDAFGRAMEQTRAGDLPKPKNPAEALVPEAIEFRGVYLG